MYRIEIYVQGELVKTFETNYFEEAAVFYYRNNDFDDRWTQLYVNGKTGNKAWMDKQMKPGRIPKKILYSFSLTFSQNYAIFILDTRRIPLDIVRKLCYIKYDLLCCPPQKRSHG